MKLVKAKEKPVSKERLSNRVLRLNWNPPMVAAQQSIRRTSVTAAVRMGEMIQLRTISTTSSHAILLAPQETIPAPTSALITVCVPLMGIPNTDDAMMKKNEAIETASIILV